MQHIQMNLLVPNLQFWSDLSEMDFPGIKQTKWTPHIFHTILHIQISLLRNISSNWQFSFYGPNLPRKVFQVENRKSEHHHGILHILISLGAKFQLKLIILSFGPNLPKKGVSTWKQNKQGFAFFIAKVSSTVVFKQFEDLRDVIILNILKEKLVMSCLQGSFYLKIV